MNDKPLNLYQKLVEVRKIVPYLQKSATSFGYKYVAGTDVLAPIVLKMNANNLILYPTVLNGTVEILEESKINKKTGEQEISRNRIVKADMIMTWIDADNPEDRLEVPFMLYGEQNDVSKAFGSGLTYSERYFLLKFFNIATDKDDPDFWHKKHSENGDQKEVSTKPKGKFEQELEDAKPPQADINKKIKYIERILEMTDKYSVTRKNKLLKFVFNTNEIKSLSLSKIEEGGKKIKEMLALPSNIDILKGDSDAPLIDPTADPIAPAGHVDPEKGAVEWKKNLERILELKKQMPESYYNGAKLKFKVVHFNEVKPLAEQRRVIKRLEDIVDTIKQSIEN